MEEVTHSLDEFPKIAIRDSVLVVKFDYLLGSAAKESEQSGFSGFFATLKAQFKMLKFTSPTSCKFR